MEDHRLHSLGEPELTQARQGISAAAAIAVQSKLLAPLDQIPGLWWRKDPIWVWPPSTAPKTLFSGRFGRARVMATLAQPQGQARKSFGDLDGQRLTRFSRFHKFRIGEDGFKQRALFGVCQFGQFNLVDFAYAVCEIGVNTEALPVAHGKQGRIKSLVDTIDVEGGDLIFTDAETPPRTRFRTNEQISDI